MMQKPTSRLTAFAADTLRFEKMLRSRIGSLRRRCEIRKITNTTGGADDPVQLILAAGAVDASEAISGEPRPTLSRTRATPRSVTPIQSMPPFHARARQPGQSPPRHDEHHGDDRKVDPEEVRPSHELHHDPAVQMAEHPARRIDRADDPERERALLGRKEIGDERHAHRHHRACAKRLDDAADRSRHRARERMIGTLPWNPCMIRDAMRGGPAWRGRDEPRPDEEDDEADEVHDAAA